MKFLIQTLFIFIPFFFLADCEKESDAIAGPSTESGNPIVLGKVVSSDSKPVGYADIYIYRSPNATDGSIAVFGTNLIATTKADINGTFAIKDKLASGSYNIEAQDSATNHSGLKSIIIPANYKENIDIDTIRVNNPGIIQGVVTRGGVLGSQTNSKLEDGFIYVKLLELDKDYVTQLDGTYRFVNIPSGTYTLAFQAADGFLTAFHDSVDVKPGNTVTLDTLILERGSGLPARPLGFDANFDTTQGVVFLSWESVILDSLEGYIVERRNVKHLRGDLFFTKDTTYQDTVSDFASGTVLHYLVRTLNGLGLTESTSAGPISISIP